MIADFFLKLSLPEWIVIIVAIVLAGGAFYYYHRTLPPLSSVRKYFLLVLRGILLILIFFLITEPVLKIIERHQEPPLMVVLYDNSASMSIPEKSGRRADSLLYVKNFIQSQKKKLDSLRIEEYAFAVDITPLQTDTLDFSVDGTDISNALSTIIDSLSGENLQQILLVTDGIYNRGSNPLGLLRNFHIPISTVVIGDTALPRDIAIRRVQTNQITYVNKEVPVEVTIWNNGFQGQRSVITIVKDGKEVARKIINLQQSGFEQKISLTLTPREVGDLNYTVLIQPLEDEITKKNNRQAFSVRVLKSKLKILVMSGAPNFDRHFLSFVGKQLNDYDFTFLTEKNRGQYYEANFQSVALDSQDLFIFHGFPTGISDANQVRSLFKQINQRKVPVFWFISQKTAPPALSNYQDQLPFSITSRISPMENQLAVLTQLGRLHPITQIDENETINEQLWKDLPPIEVYPQLKIPEGVQLLLVVPRTTEMPATQDNIIPVAYTYRRNGIKYFVFNGANFGNWHFQLQEDQTRESLFREFLQRTIRWLVNKDDIEQIQIKPTQKIYNVGESVVFTGQVYGNFYQPVYDATVTITLKGDSAYQVSDEMLPLGNGFYRSLFSGLPEGKFQYIIHAERNKQLIGERKGSLTVKPFFLEFQHIPANGELLRKIAYNTGGEFYFPAAFVKSFPSGSFETRTYFLTKEFFLWRFLYWLPLFILLLGTEWFFRKRWGLL
ncbi:MAG: VWA domain-containing protein [Calditrichaeota bacterium]|nr:MAG: VWA domain-containing protein [Calditrichota bacterium]